MRTHQVRKGAAFDCIVIIIVIQGQSLQLLEALQDGNLALGVLTWCILGACKDLEVSACNNDPWPHGKKMRSYVIDPKKNEKDSE